MSEPGDGERDRAFRAEQRRQLKAGLRLQADTRAELLRLLRQAQAQITAVLAGSPTEFQAWRLPQLKAEIARTIATLDGGAEAALGSAFPRVWQAGVELIDQPLAAAGVGVSERLVALDPRLLDALRVFCTDRIKNVTAEIGNKVNTDLGLVALGTHTPFEAAQKVAGYVDGGMKRASTIVHTELGAAYSAAAQQRQEQAQALLPGLRKQWRRSGKRHPRFTHVVADGQIKPVDQPFEVGGVKLMYPRDPKAPPGERINCGCTSLPLMASWEVAHPAALPVAPAERADSRVKRQIDDVRSEGFARLADRLAQEGGQRLLSGRVEALSELSPTVVADLRQRGLSLVSTDLAISDVQLRHLVAHPKGARGAALPLALARELPALIERPEAVLWDKRAKSPTLVYVLAGGDAARKPRVVVRLADREKRNQVRQANWIVSGGWDEVAQLRSRSFERIEGTV